MNKKILAMMFLALMTTSCKKDKKPQTTQITPVEFPSDTGVDGFKFPEDPNTIYTWLNSEDNVSIAKHAWGIWAGLTKDSGQSYNGQKLPVYDTWHGVGELSAAVGNGDKNAGCNVKVNRAKLNRPKQFGHAGLQAENPINDDYVIVETVSYSPASSCFASQNLIFNQSTLNKYMVKDDIGKIPEFPVTSITTKPTYYVTKSNTGLVRLPAWTTTPVPAKVFGNKLWNNWVYVDLDNKQDPDKKLVPVTVDNPTPEQLVAATCNANNFIYFKLDADEAAYLNSKQDNGTPADHQFSAGDVALLVAMHVTTKEIPNWTWQTYFWVPQPDYPGDPSSPTYAKLRPSTLSPAAAHYAVSPCYAMVYPNQPITGGTDKDAEPIICYNPYLEAGFGPNVFQYKNTWQPDFQYGVQTNCASCHALATMTGNLGYSTNQYIDMKNPAFKNDVQLDFAWSIQGNINANK